MEDRSDGIRGTSQVEVVVGVDQGKQGVVKDIIQKRNLIVVEGVRAFTRSVGPTPGYKDGKTGGVVTEERSLRYEEVLLVDPQLKYVHKAKEDTVLALTDLYF
jgi:ribosomal protein L24